MAWDVKYRLEFKDFFGVDWKVDILDETAASTISELSGKGSPLTFNFLCNGDGVIDYPVRGSTLDIQIYSDTNFEYINLYSFGNLKWKVQVYHGATLYWQGFINSDGYQEPYDQVPYFLTLQAADGLGQLKNIEFKDNGEYYNGRILESEIIIDILAKIGFTGFTEYVNLYEDTMSSGVADSPFDQCKIDADVFKDMYCYDVIQSILKKYNACIRQQNGEMIIYRPFELKGTTVKGRKFTAATTKTAATDITTAQYINRTGNVSDIHSVEGGTLRIHPPAKRITAHQDFGNKESWIDNYEFKASTFDGSDFEYWERVHSLAINPIGTWVKGEKDGIAISPVVASPTPYITQSFGSGSIVSTTDLFVLKFDYGYYNDSTSTINNVDIIVKIRQGAKHLGEDGADLIWTTDTIKEIRLRENIAAGWSGWTAYEHEFTGIDTASAMSILLFGSVWTNAYVCLRNIQLYAVSTQIMRKQMQRKLKERVSSYGILGGAVAGTYGFLGAFIDMRSKYYTVNHVEQVSNITEQSFVVDNAIEGGEIECDYILGDVLDVVTPDPDFVSNNIENITEQFKGSLATYVSGVLASSVSWSTRGGTESLSLIDLISREIAHHYARPKQLISLPIHERNGISNNPQIKLIANFQDNLNQYDSSNRVFVINSATFNVEERIWNLELAEIDQDAPAAPVTPDAPSAPVATAATLIGTTEFTANWNASTGAIRYYLDISESNVFASFVSGFENLNVGNNLSSQITGLDVNTTYYYRVRAYDIFGQTSSNSNTITVATLASATYQLYTDTKFFLIPEATTWTVLVENLSISVAYNNNFRLKLVGTADGTPVTYTAITSDVAIAAADSEFVVGTWDAEITGFDWDEEYTLSIEYDQGSADFVMLASRTYNS